MIPRAIMDGVVAEIKPKFPQLTMIVLLMADDEGVSMVVHAKEEKTHLVPDAIRMSADMVEEHPGELL